MTERRETTTTRTVHHSRSFDQDPISDKIAYGTNAPAYPAYGPPRGDPYGPVPPPAYQQTPYPPSQQPGEHQIGQLDKLTLIW